MRGGTELGRVRGLGAAKEGTHHWWTQRVTAGANLALMLWFVLSVARMPGYDYDAVHAWLASPLAAIPMVLLVVSVFWHFRLGLQVLIEDYQADESRVVALVALNFFTVAAAATAIFAILKVAFTPVAVAAAGVPA